MMKNVKTPAMILQELTVKESLPPPEYILILSKSGTHENEFHYQVTVGGVSAVGFGRSKQVAKHDTAQKALQLLAEKGTYCMDTDSVQEFNPKLHRNETDSRSAPPVNFVGTLKDLSYEQKIPLPNFVELSDVGPPHARQFTWRCNVSSIVTQATANTKKQAKQLCAQEMLERLKDVAILKEIVDEEKLQERAITEDDTVANRYRELSASFPGVIPNKAISIGNYDTVIASIMEENFKSIEDFAEEFEEGTESALERLLTQLNLTYKIDQISAKCPVVVLSISVDIPLCCIGYGHTLEEAKSDVVRETFKLLKYHMEIKD